MQNVAPRLSRTPGRDPLDRARRWASTTHEVLHDLLGCSDAEIPGLTGAPSASHLFRRRETT